MAEHFFSTREQLLSFWNRGIGYLLNNYRIAMVAVTLLAVASPSAGNEGAG